MQLALARKDELFNGSIIASSSFYTGSSQGYNYSWTWFISWWHWHVQRVRSHRRSRRRRKIKPTRSTLLTFTWLFKAGEQHRPAALICVDAGIIQAKGASRGPAGPCHSPQGGGSSPPLPAVWYRNQITVFILVFHTKTKPQSTLASISLLSGFVPPPLPLFFEI